MATMLLQTMPRAVIQSGKLASKVASVELVSDILTTVRTAQSHTGRPQGENTTELQLVATSRSRAPVPYY